MTIQENFRLAMRRYIYSVSIMSNIDKNGVPNAITVAPITNVLNLKKRERRTLPVTRKSPP